MKFAIFLFLVTELVINIQSKIIHYDNLESANRPRTLETILNRPQHQDSVHEGYRVLGTQEPSALPSDSNVLEVAKRRERLSQEEQDYTRLETLTDFLSCAKSNVLSQPRNEPVGIKGLNDLSFQQPSTSALRRGGRRGRKRGGRRRRGRGKKHRGRGRRYRDQAVNSRFKRSKESSYVFNQEGVFEGLQPLPFSQDQMMDIFSILGANEQNIERSESQGHLSDLSFDMGTAAQAATLVGDLDITGGANVTNSKGNFTDTTTTNTNSDHIEVIEILNLDSGRNGKRKSKEKKQERKRSRANSAARNRAQDILDVTKENIEVPTETMSTQMTDGVRRGRLDRRRDNDGTRSRGRRRQGEGQNLGDEMSPLHDNQSFRPSRLQNGAVFSERRSRPGKSRRAKRALTKDGLSSLVGSFTVPKGKLYKWTRNLAGMNSVNEFAFSSTERNVAVVMSFDPTLESLGFSNGATLYDFTGRHGIMALRPRVSASPCYLMEPSQTFDEILAELTERNSSSVWTNTERYLDGSGNPLSEEEKEAVLQQTPSLRRQCRGRSIVRATPYGMHPTSHSGPAKDIKLLTLDNEVTMTVRVQSAADASKVNGSSFPGQLIRRWGRLRSVLGRGSGRLTQWIGQGRWGRGQSRGQRSREGVKDSRNDTSGANVTPVPSVP